MYSTRKVVNMKEARMIVKRPPQARPKSGNFTGLRQKVRTSSRRLKGRRFSRSTGSGSMKAKTSTRTMPIRPGTRNRAIMFPVRTEASQVAIMTARLLAMPTRPEARPYCAGES